MAREMAGEGMRLLARAGAGGRVVAGGAAERPQNSPVIGAIPVEVNLA
jgi:hypothetical protein